MNARFGVAWRFLRSHLPELALAAILSGQLAFLLHVFPLEARFFLNPDDFTAFQFARRLPETLLPVLPYDLPLYDVSPYGIFASQSAFLNQDGALVPRGPPGLFYLLAPFAPFSLETANVGMMALCTGTFVLLYAYLRPLAGSWGALAGTTFFAFAPSTLFWSTFLLANVPAIGVLLGGLILLRSPRPLLCALGGLLLCLSVLFRYEYVVLLFAIGVFWLMRNLRALGRRTPQALATVGGVLAGLALVLGMSWGLYQTPNFVSATIMQDDSASETIANTVGTTKADNIQGNFGLVASAFAAYLVLAATALWLRPARSAELMGLSVGVAVLSVFFLGNTFTVTPFFFNRSLVRYFIPVTLLAAIGLAFLLAASHRRPGIAVALGLVVCLSAGASLALVSGDEGFGYAKEYLATGHEEIRQAERLAMANPKTALVGEHSAKQFLDLPVMAAFFHLPEEVRGNETKRVVKELLSDGYHVYGLNRFAGDYRHLLGTDPLFRIAPSGQPLYWEVLLAKPA